MCKGKRERFKINSEMIKNIGKGIFNFYIGWEIGSEYLCVWNYLGIFSRIYLWLFFNVF